VHRAPDSHDGRAHRIELTEAGRRVAVDVAQRRADRLSAVLEKIPKAQRPAVVRSLRALEEASRDLP
jgi:DNA-binding MarR family transcriptional regulator